MKRKGLAISIVTVALLLPAVPSDAQRGHGRHHGGQHSSSHHSSRHHTFSHHRSHHGSHGGIFIDDHSWWPYSHLYAYPYWSYYPSPYYYSYRLSPVQEPSVYIQQQQPSPAAAEPPYWYFCPSAKAYYPSIQQCSEAWIMVPPTPR